MAHQAIPCHVEGQCACMLMDFFCSHTRICHTSDDHQMHVAQCSEDLLLKHLDFLHFEI